MGAFRLAKLTYGWRLLGAIAVCAAVMFGPGAPALARQDTVTEAKATFSELNDSGISGVTSLVTEGDTTTVAIWADGALGDHPTHIHEGTCADFDPNPQFPLTNVVLQTSALSGTSVSEVDVSVEDLLDSPHLILIHKSQEEIGTYIACGDIVAGALTDAEVASGHGYRQPDGRLVPQPGNAACSAGGGSARAGNVPVLPACGDDDCFNRDAWGDPRLRIAPGAIASSSR
jgi:hypothetical protein